MNLLAYLRTQWDRAGAVAAAGLGAVVLLLGYLGTRGAVLVEQQMPYVVSGGLLGIFLLALGGVLWLSADLRDDWREVKDLAAQVTRLAAVEERAGDDRAIPGLLAPVHIPAPVVPVVPVAPVASVAPVAPAVAAATATSRPRRSTRVRVPE